MRHSNTDRSGRGFSVQTISAVWRKAKLIPGTDGSVLRKDSCGAWISRGAYGNTNSENGWEIDHIMPVSKGGSDSIANLQPLQWENNRSKGDKYPNWTCAVHAA